MKHISCQIILLLLVLQVGFSQDQPADGEHARFEDPLLENLVGIWKLTGVVAGDPVTNTFEAKWILNHQFLQLHYQDINFPSQYEAWVFIGFNHAEKRYVVHWLDIFGGRYSETLGFGQRENHTIRFLFKSTEGGLQNTFTWFPATQHWSSVIEQTDESGNWQIFASQEMRREDPAKK